MAWNDLKQCVYCSGTYKPTRLHQKYCSLKCRGIANSGPSHYGWKGVTYKRGRCFLSINGKRVLRSRVVMEQKLGRPLLSTEVVHHKDLNKLNDHPDNLELKSDQADHRRAHATVFRSETHKECRKCHEIKPRGQFDAGRRKEGCDPQHTQCKACRAAYYAERWRRGLTSCQ